LSTSNTPPGTLICNIRAPEKYYYYTVISALTYWLDPFFNKEVESPGALVVHKKRFCIMIWTNTSGFDKDFFRLDE